MAARKNVKNTGYGSAAAQARRKAAAQQRYASRQAAQASYRAPMQPALRGFLGADAKYVDVANTAYVADTTGTITHLSVVPQGTTVNSRDGKAWVNTTLLVRGNVGTPDSSDYGPQVAALYIVWDKQPNKALPAITDILDSASANAFSKRENALRFQIVRKFRYSVEGSKDTALTNSSGYDVDQYVRLPSDAVSLTTAGDTTGAIGNRIQGALYAVTVGTAGSGDAARFNVGYRLNFKDV